MYFSELNQWGGSFYMAKENIRTESNFREIYVVYLWTMSIVYDVIFMQQDAYFKNYTWHRITSKCFF